VGLQSTTTGKATQARRTGLVATSLRLNFSRSKKDKAPDIPRRGGGRDSVSRCIPKLAGRCQAQMLLSGTLEREGPSKLADTKPSSSHGKLRAGSATLTG